ncbi:MULTISPECIES: CATRA conflict system CASPASE/TPR repeat-associated protein [Pseudofrankia]|uniref:CATRA conflict system CASPASE/TPR repeat-associated protein n=1 Tax=Pseudofrankia TaxID=2994363 RepID=UPI000234DA6A|nr:MULTISPECIES: CATRA conflict system CASPASE/TPR repeat-associated protein [Pseudofrankia]OHV32267.1 hypothetical protein BCD49_30300 [Pseudofrankia sp. EUN1h]
MSQELTAAELDALMAVFPDVKDARRLLRVAGFPNALVPADSGTVGAFWFSVFEALRSGAVVDGRIRLLTAARDLHPANPAFAASRTRVTDRARDTDQDDAPPDLRDAELVVHLFAPADGPRAEAAYAHLLSVWERCRDHLGMRHPAPGLRLATRPPAALGRATGDLAAVDGGGEGVYQALLRRDHDLVRLSAVLAPAAGAGAFDWTPLDALWSRAVGPLSTDLVGAVRIYQGHVRRRADDGQVTVSEALARGCRHALPPSEGGRPGWEERGVTTGSGFGVWELGEGDDLRIERQIVVLAAAERDHALSAYTWTRTDQSLPYLVGYLANAAKVRYQYRVWSDAPSVAALRERAATDVTELRRRLMSPRADVASGADPAEAVLTDRLLVHLDLLVAARADRDDMRESVEIAVSNIREMLREDRSPEDGPGLFAEDLRLATYLTEQLGRDRFFLTTAVDRVKSTLRTARRLGGTTDA